MIFAQLSQQLGMLHTLLNKISKSQYVLGIKHLDKSSIGAHTRHIIELLQCTINGYHNGYIDYINRQRNLQLEQDKEFASVTIEQLLSNIPPDDRLLKIATEADKDKLPIPVSTTYYREIVYNTEHIIHHLALIKVALTEMKLAIVDSDFGMAYSTIKYKAVNNQ